MHAHGLVNEIFLFLVLRVVLIFFEGCSGDTPAKQSVGGVFLILVFR